MLHLILGGRCMGKRAYAESLYGMPDSTMLLDFSTDTDALLRLESLSDRINNYTRAIWLVNLQDGVRALMNLMNLPDIQEFFLAPVRQVLGYNESGKTGTVIAIGNEIGYGIVPMDPFERRWRDETGRLYQALAAEADIVDRVWSGLAMNLKRR